jgi:hypothetical protein
MLQPFPEVVVGASVGIVLLGSAQLVFGFQERANVHDRLQRRYYDLLAKLDECVDPTSAFCKQILGEISRITSDEPPTLRVLDAVAYNEALDALYGEAKKAQRLKIGLWRYWFRHTWAFNGAQFKSISEV